LRPSAARTVPSSTTRLSAGTFKRDAAIPTSISRTCAAAFMIAVPLSFIELLPAV
jgi:hypothetical protein